MTSAPSTDGLTIPVPRYLHIGLYLLLLLLVVSTITLGSVPPVDRDALTHHLFVPKLYLQHGGIYEIPEIPFSYYPMNLDLLYMIPLYFGNDIIPKYIHYLFALLTAWLIFRYLKANIGYLYALVGSLFFLSIPVIVKLSITVYVDLGVVFFTTAALLFLLQWADDGFRYRHLILAGLCCGLAAGTKYNALVAIVVLTLFVPIIYQRRAVQSARSNTRAFFFGFLFLTATIVSFSPWLLRNYLWTGNPIYPLHNTLIQNIVSAPDETGTSEESIELSDTLKRVTKKGSNAFISRKILYNEPWWQTLLLPVRFFFEGQDDDPRYFDGKLNPFLLLFPLIAIILKPTDTRQRFHLYIFLSFSFLYFFFTFFQEAMRIRYIVPVVPPLIILSMYGLKAISTHLFPITLSFPKNLFWSKAVILTLVCTALLYNSLYLREQFSAVNPFPYIFQNISREDYITTYRPEFPVIQHANETLSSDTKVLCIFLGNRGYYMNFKPLFEQPYSSTSVLTGFINNFGKTESIISYLKQKGITHIIMNNNLTAGWYNQLNKEHQKLVYPLFKNVANPMKSLNGYSYIQIETQF